MNRFSTRKGLSPSKKPDDDDDDDDNDDDGDNDDDDATQHWGQRQSTAMIMR
jgi:hypothetical protein